jgi:murein DD-endopeptidase MepM/ murein hydrolase activator NlpD
VGVAAIDGRREHDSITGSLRAPTRARRRLLAGVRAFGHLLLHGGSWPRIAVAAAVALAFALTGELVASKRSAPPAAPAEPLLATTKVDRLDAYARESAAADAVVPPVGPSMDDSGAFDWASASRRIATHTVTGAHGERTYVIRIIVPEGTLVRAAADGTVEFAGDAADGLGAKVVLRHGAVKSVYAHARELRVKARERVRKGQVIARSGQSGFVTSPRLYLALVSGDPEVDPVAFFAGAVAGKAERCADPMCDDRKAPAKTGSSALAPRQPVPPGEIPGRAPQPGP